MSGSGVIIVNANDTARKLSNLYRLFLMKDKTMFTPFIRKLLSENYSRHIDNPSISCESGENR
jgi:hypothetical protein